MEGEEIMLPGSYFIREEGACKCGCGFDTMDAELLFVLQTLRAVVGEPIGVNSWCRCEKHNRNVGGKKKSQHLLGKAADIVVGGVHPKEVYRLLNDIFPNQYGIGDYKTFTHIDVREKKWRG